MERWCRARRQRRALRSGAAGGLGADRRIVHGRPNGLPILAAAEWSQGRAATAQPAASLLIGARPECRNAASACSNPMRAGSARLEGLAVRPEGHTEGRVGIAPDTGARGGNTARSSGRGAV